MRAKASSGVIDHMKNLNEFQFVKLGGLIYRICLSSNRPDKLGYKSLVVPDDYLPLILSMAHESPLANHFTRRKTEIKVAEHYFWLKMGADIKLSADKCRRFSAWV